jgi:SAM-dependent methyltransferase
MLIKLLAMVRSAIGALGLLPLIKRVLYAPATAAQPGVSSGWRYRLKILIEQANFSSVTQVHELPAIHDYWSKAYVQPKLDLLGYRSIEDFFLHNLKRAFKASAARPLRCASIGAGNCDFEIRIAELLSADGIADFIIECIDLNQAMLDRGMRLAAERGMSGHIVPVRADFNAWQPSGRYDAVMANMSLHHVVNLEGLLCGVKQALQPWGLFIAFDMIGRNGHMRWPEALAIVNEYWRQLPPSHQYNRMLATRQNEYINFDCSRAGFEGIRAQDILPLLVKLFHFESFVAFANVIEPFIDRAVGYNFDPQRTWDREFIDRIQARDEEELRVGRVKPTHMLAAMAGAATDRAEYIGPLTPAFCVRPPDTVKEGP